MAPSDVHSIGTSDVAASPPPRIDFQSSVSEQELKGVMIIVKPAGFELESDDPNRSIFPTERNQPVAKLEAPYASATVAAIKFTIGRIRCADLTHTPALLPSHHRFDSAAPYRPS
ncbi:hypothetical protein A0H81_10431 [Grifola frondosa]|uniref:Uncharacterized protein n=1 Tax=Grifola frondosa TaxID=5627 RepID=A0A1C7LXR2_GRIFR|nr:hypothetical protein A0H81_10431 [Grifola frondosa]